MNGSDVRVPPHNLEAEAAILGAALLDNAAFPDDLEPRHFYRTGNQVIWEVMSFLKDTGTPVDLVTLANELRKNEKIEQAGGIAYLSELTNQVPSVEGARYYADIVIELSERRSLIWAATEAIANAYGDRDLADILTDLNMSVSLTEKVSPLTMKQGVEKFTEHLKDVQAGKNKPTAVTGFRDIDESMRLMAGDLAIVAGRPGMGKSAFGLCAAYQSAKAGFPTLYVSIEMTETQLLGRLMSVVSRVDAAKIRSGNFEVEDYAALAEGCKRLLDIPLFIVASPKINSVGKIKAIASGMKKRHGIRLVVVDHLHRMREPGKWTRQDLMVGAIAHGLKNSALDLEIVVMALCQLNRQVESRMPPTPIMSDLRESGAIEEEADEVLFLYRQDYYEEQDRFDGKKGFRDDLVGKVLVSLSKNRHGSPDAFLLAWVARHVAMSDLESRYETPRPGGGKQRKGRGSGGW